MDWNKNEYPECYKQIVHVSRWNIIENIATEIGK